MMAGSVGRCSRADRRRAGRLQAGGGGGRWGGVVQIQKGPARQAAARSWLSRTS